MKGLFPIFKRELLAYFRSPVAYVFIIIFLAANAGCTFLLGNFYNSNQASLENSFLFSPLALSVPDPCSGNAALGRRTTFGNR